mmetsp:Transcript_87967/g.139751  ORF Transcript_87967/g.139751 Transcript_87967/m.139751 type:complete len:231 (-) Transcript_87967:186-878(-)
MCSTFSYDGYELLRWQHCHLYGIRIAEWHDSHGLIFGIRIFGIFGIFSSFVLTGGSRCFMMCCLPSCLFRILPALASFSTLAAANPKAFTLFPWEACDLRFQLLHGGAVDDHSKLFLECRDGVHHLADNWRHCVINCFLCLTDSLVPVGRSALVAAAELLWSHREMPHGFLALLICIDAELLQVHLRCEDTFPVSAATWVGWHFRLVLGEPIWPSPVRDLGGDLGEPSTS